MIIQIIFIIIGFLLLIKGADFLVKGGSNIAKRFHIPEIVIGLTIVSIGTSMPELFISKYNKSDISYEYYGLVNLNYKNKKNDKIVPLEKILVRHNKNVLKSKIKKTISGIPINYLY